jgi:sugar phosphate isomerase/epimerase
VCEILAVVHPRLSVNSLSSYSWSFAQELALWRDLGVAWAGVIGAKLGDNVESGLAKLTEAGIRVSTVIAPGFDLGNPDSWDTSRRELHRMIDAVAKRNGWSLYITPGRTTFAPWGDVLDTFARAAGPSADYARNKGVRLAFEPSMRSDVSFINTIRDAIDGAEASGLGIVVDFGNCWMERDFREVLLRAAPHIALVQASDAQVGPVLGPGQPPGSGRVPFGEGELPIARMLRDVKDTGYDGPIELELPGQLGETEGYESVIRRGVEKACLFFEEAGL